MQISEILSSQLVPGAAVIDLTSDDADLSVSALLPPELELSYRRELQGGSSDKPRQVLLVQTIPEQAPVAALGAEVKNLAQRVVHAVFVTRIEALLEQDVLAAATRDGWKVVGVHASEHPVWRAMAFLEPATAEESQNGLGSTNERRAKEALLRIREAQLAEASKKIAELEQGLVQLEARKPTTAQVQRLEWKLKRRNETVRELQEELRVTSKVLADLRRSFAETMSKMRAAESKLGQYRQALANARGSVSFRLGRATKVALRGNPLDAPKRWFQTFNGEDEIVAKLEGAPRRPSGAPASKRSEARTNDLKAAATSAYREIANSGQALAAWWSSPGVVRFRKRTERSQQDPVAESPAAVARGPGATPPDVTQQWLHIVTPPPAGTNPARPRLELPSGTLDLPPGVDLHAFEDTWRRLCETRASAACIGELVGKKTDNMDDALLALLPALAGKRLVDEPVPAVTDARIKVRHFRSYALPTPIDWTADPRGIRDWRFWFQNLAWLDGLRGDHGVAAAAFVVTDWAERALTRDPPLEMTWEEHSVCVRLARVWRFLQAYVESSDVLNRRVLHAAVHIVLTHIYALTRREVYAAQHNHGLMQDQALLTHVAQLPTLRDRDKLFELGEYRVLCLQVALSVTGDAVHHENSPHYHILFAKVLATLLNEAYGPYGRKPPEVLLQTRDALLETFVYLIQPDMTVPQLGDSVNESREPELAFVLQQTEKSFPLPPDLLAQIQYVRTDGREGQPPPHTDRVFVEGGYACFREKWAPGSAHKVITAHFRCSRLSNVHYHQDETSFEIYGYGRKLIAESGRFNNDKGSPLHNYQRSTHAHNVLTVDGRGFGKFKLPSRIVDHRVGRYLSWVQGSHDYYAALGIKDFVRTFIYSKYNLFVVLDSLQAKGDHVYEQHFHLHPTLSELSYPAPGTVVATTETSGGPAVVLTAGTVPERIRTVRGQDPETGEQSWYFPNENISAPATDVIFSHRRDAGRVHLPVFITVFPSEDKVELLPIEHEITDRELAVAIEPLRYARHIVVPLYDPRRDSIGDKTARDASRAAQPLSAKLARGG